jgi:hypothetical protein
MKDENGKPKRRKAPAPRQPIVKILAGPITADMTDQEIEQLAKEVVAALAEEEEHRKAEED